MFKNRLIGKYFIQEENYWNYEEGTTGASFLLQTGDSSKKSGYMRGDRIQLSAYVSIFGLLH